MLGVTLLRGTSRLQLRFFIATSFRRYLIPYAVPGLPNTWIPGSVQLLSENVRWYSGMLESPSYSWALGFALMER